MKRISKFLEDLGKGKKEPVVEKQTSKQAEAVQPGEIPQKPVRRVPGIITPTGESGEKVAILEPYSQTPYQSQWVLKPKYKPLISKKLTIFFIENTTQVAQRKDSLSKMINNLVAGDLMCVINYGAKVKLSEVVEVSSLKTIPVLNEQDVGEQACLYDALAELKSLVSEKHWKIEEKEKERVQIETIEIIGIGTCKDNGSKASKEEGIDYFYKVARTSKVFSKYFCLTEESFINAAEIGFRSIGAIDRNY